MTASITQACTCRQLLADYRQAARPATNARKLRFDGVAGYDVYNNTAAFRLNGETLIAARVERRQDEMSRTIVFRQDGNCWEPHADSPVWEYLQDPCVTVVDGELILGGVRIDVDADTGRIQDWHMRFYRGRSLAELAEFAHGPPHMKDVRLVQLGDGRIAIASRPQGEAGGRGTIGFTVVDSLEHVTAKAIANAPLFKDQFIPEEWGGCNELHRLPNGRIGALGHVASWDADDPEKRHYYAMAFGIDPVTRETSPVKIIAVRGDFPDGPAKRPDLHDVIFSGGLVRNRNGTATLYAGLSDCESGCIDIPDPFLVSEKDCG